MIPVWAQVVLGIIVVIILFYLVFLAIVANMFSNVAKAANNNPNIIVAPTSNQI